MNSFPAIKELFSWISKFVVVSESTAKKLPMRLLGSAQILRMFRKLWNTTTNLEIHE